MDDGRGQEEYIRQVLEAYRKTPGTMGTVRRPDRVLAAQLYQRGVSVSVIENALVWNGISGNGADGFVFWVANSGVQQNITGGNCTINGVMYMPGSPVNYTGGNGTQQTLVVDTLDVTGGNVSTSYSSS